MEKLLTKAEVCEMLQISRATLDRIVASGELVALRVGAQVRFEKNTLLLYLGRCREVKPGASRSTAPEAPKEPARRGRPKGSRKAPPEQHYFPGMKVV